MFVQQMEKSSKLYVKRSNSFARWSTPRVVRQLGEYALDAVGASLNNWTELQRAAADGTVEDVRRALADSTVEIDAQDDNARSALMLAVIRADAAGREKALIIMRKGARVYLHDEDGLTCISHAALLGEHALVIDMATAGELPVHLGAPAGSPCAALCEEPLCGLPSWTRMERGTAGNHTAQLMTVRAIVGAYARLPQSAW